MKTIKSEVIVKIPDGVKVQAETRQVTVTGPLGTINKSFKHLNVEIVSVDKSSLRVTVWFGTRKHNACVRTVASHIQNMIKGVTKGFKFTMKACSTHFPINMHIASDKKTIEVRNYLGEKFTRVIPMLPGVTVAMTGEKDEIMLTGIDLENVSQSAATIQQACASKKKDIRKFLDGIYVSNRGALKE